MPKSVVFSWRLTPELKSQLEMAARAEHTSITALLERLSRSWLAARNGEDEAARMARLRQAAADAAGIFDDDHATATNARVRDVIQSRMKLRHGRSRPD